MNGKRFITIKEYIVMAIALAIYVVGWTAFLIPNQIPGGGITGLSSIINYSSGIPIAYSYFILNIVLLILGTIIIGKGFVLKTIYCVLISSIFFEFFPLIPWTLNIQDSLLNSIIGVGFSRIGISLDFT